MFRLSRYFAITSFIGIAAAVVALSLFYRELAFQSAIDHEARANAALSKVFASGFWPDVASFLAAAPSIPQAELRTRPEIAILRAKILGAFSELDIVKVKIYTPDGLTAFSTDPSQIGEDQSANPGFRSALSGAVSSSYTSRDSFDTFDRHVVHRDLVSSYVPVRNADLAPVDAVFEIYSDVTPLLAQIGAAQWRAGSGVVAFLAVLYAFLVIVARRADRIVSAREAEARKRHEATLRHQAHHDELTGLPNRTNLMARLDDAIKLARRSGKPLAVMSLDLDRFKDVNDSFGPKVGDRLLRIVGERLKTCLRETDTVARLGGDEFTVILLDLARAEHAAEVAAKLNEAVTRPAYVIDGQEFMVTTSIGISVHPDDGADVDVLLKKAEAALSFAKAAGSATYRFYTPEMTAQAVKSVALDQDLRRALERHEFRLHYQPLFDALSERIVGAEALIRWQHPERGFVSPMEFIPLAEARGLIGPIGEWAFNEACRQGQAWHDAGLPNIPIAVNVSPTQLRDRTFINGVARSLRDGKFAPAAGHLEITESGAMERGEDTINMLREFKAMGLGLSVDDFGTGYSSLSHLKRMPIDKLKIDRSFVTGLPGDGDDAAIVTAILDMAKALKLKVVAEGVETRGQLEFLRAKGCDTIHGYLFSKPLAPDDFMALARQQPALAA